MADLVVKVQEGELKGFINTSKNGKKYYSFVGIPFAEPPVGNLRFKDPVPVKPWNGIRDATKEGGICAQVFLFTDIYAGGDDCLYLNVHTPKLKGSGGSPLPVMFNIHGGGFVNGSGNVAGFGPDYIVEEDTIMVTINYRLGLVGFLCTDAVNARGDMGLLDQQLAMKWVKENIAAFNGDSNNITLFGISAGSASVEYQLLAKKSHDYFHKAILQSGSSLNPWSRTRNPMTDAKNLAKVLGYTSESDDGIFEFLNQFDTKDLLLASGKMLNDDYLKEGILFIFPPVVNQFKDNKGFLNEEPIDILKNGGFNKIPIISGLCEKEGMMIPKNFYNGEEVQNYLKNNDYIKCIPSYLNKNMNNCEERLKKTYEKNGEDINSNDNIINFLSDVSFNAGIFVSLEQRLKHNPNVEYFYKFAYDSEINFVKNMFHLKEAGACHGDDTTYLGPSTFVSQDILDKTTAQDILVKDRMVKMWTNFAKYGNPTPNIDDIINEKWLPITKEKFNYMNISDDLKMSDDMFAERRKLWSELYEKI